jgi:hypothetical protein
LYGFVVRLLAVAIRPFLVDRSSYNTVGRIPYYAAGLFSCAAGLLDPLGIHLLLVSTMPAAFGGSSGLMWADNLVPGAPAVGPDLFVRRDRVWWVAAVLIGAAYIAVLGPGIRFTPQADSAAGRAAGHERPTRAFPRPHPSTYVRRACGEVGCVDDHS